MKTLLTLIIIISVGFSPLVMAKKSDKKSKHMIVLREAAPVDRSNEDPVIRKMLREDAKQLKREMRKDFRESAKVAKQTTKEIVKHGYVVEDEAYIHGGMSQHLNPSTWQTEYELGPLTFTPVVFSSLSDSNLEGYIGDESQLVRIYYTREFGTVILVEDHYMAGEDYDFMISPPNGLVQINGQDADYYVAKTHTQVMGFTMVVHYTDEKVFMLMIDKAITLDDPQFPEFQALLDDLY